MSESNFSIRTKASLLYKSFIFITVLLLTFSLISEENQRNNKNLEKKHLRQLDMKTFVFTVVSVFSYLYIIFFFSALYVVTMLYYQEVKDQEKIFYKLIISKILFIINLGYLIANAFYFFFYDYNNLYILLMFIISFASLVTMSLFYIKDCKDGNCYLGICQFNFLYVLATIPSLVCNFPFEDEHCCCCRCFGEGNEDFSECCINFGKSIGIFLGYLLLLFNVITYYLGFPFYSLFWLVGKVFVSLGCCKSCCKEGKFDMDTFRESTTSNTPLNFPEKVEEEEDNKSVKMTMKKNYIIVEKTIKVRYKIKKPA